GQSISTWKDLTTIIEDNPEKELNVTIERNGQRESTTATQRLEEIEDIKKGKLGVYKGFEKHYLKTLKNGLIKIYKSTKLILTILGMLITGQYSHDMLSVTVGIYDATDQVVKTGFMNFLVWTAMLSINLGIVNLVPLPALDGGRLLFVGIEAVRGKPI